MTKDTFMPTFRSRSSHRTGAAQRAAMIALICALAGTGVAKAQTVDATTLNHKNIMGFQGWFACPGDGRKTNDWRHWFSREADRQDHVRVDLLPDVSELGPDERCPTNLTSRSGKPIEVFSDQNPKTVARQFQWMRKYGIDGVALQRFVGPLGDPDSRAPLDRVLANVRQGAEANGRVFFVMYDITMNGHDPAQWAQLIEEDWRRLLKETEITKSPAYLHHGGHPVLAIWGAGFKDRPARPDSTKELIAALRRDSAPYGGVTLIGGVPTYWRTLKTDSMPDPDWAQAYRSFDIISPWTVGRFSDDEEADRYKNDVLIPDLAEARRSGVGYMPVVFPGYSAANAKAAAGRSPQARSFPRRCGAFYWRQVFNAVTSGATMLYTAMFDEVDEGTAMFKTLPGTDDLPATGSFVAIGADGCRASSDLYLKLGGQATQLLKGEIPPSPTAKIAP